MTSPRAKTPIGVGRRHDQPERRSVAGGTALPDEVGRDDRLPVARREGVGGAPEEGEPERDEDDAETEVFLRDQAGEAVAFGLSGCWCRVFELGCPARERARPELGFRDRDVERLGEQVLWVGTELVADAGCRCVRGDDPRTALAADDELAPTDAVRVVRVSEAELGSGAIGLEDGFEPERGEAAGARPGVDARRENTQDSRPTVELELEAARDLPGESGPANAVAFLVRGDLGQVEDVLHVHAVAGSLDRAVAVDREVAEWMCLGAGGDRQRSEQADEERETLHDAYLRATGLQRSEKWGFRLRARANHSRASAWSPRQRSIIPRWKYFSASRVPSRSERRE